MPNAPLPYDPADETLEPGEEATTRALIETFHGIQQKVLDDSGHAERAVHAKSHGLFEARLEVAPHLPPELAQGVFQPGAAYDAVIRISAIPGDILPDEITLPRGFSVKLLDVAGERLPGSEGATTQDFVMVNAEHFQAKTAKQFLASLKPVAATTDRVEALKKGLSAVNRRIEAVIEAFGGESALLKATGGAPMTHPLGDSFFSQTAFRYGDHVARFSLAPADAALRALKDQPVDVRGRPDGFRELVQEHVARHGAAWDFRVQLRTDPAMPIEDASAPWSERESPWRPVARLTAPPQPGWSQALSRRIDDAMAFSVWHGVEAHRPLGRINRVRKDAYQAAANFRSAGNGCPVREPKVGE
jgi:hypothetical protein